MEAKASKSKFFTSLDYYSKRDAKINLSEALTNAGWKIYGFHENKSDAMTDYYSPAYWDGVAIKNDYVLCVDVSSPSYSGVPITKVDETWAQCTMCNGNGQEPHGWSLQDARQRPQEYHLSKLLKQYPGSMTVSENEIVTPNGNRVSAGLNRVVSPIPFLDNGHEKCSTCGGRGEVLAKSESIQIDAWPTFQVNPKRKAWHLEKDGTIVTSGMSIAKLYEGYYDGTREEKIAAVQASAADLIATLAMFINSEIGVTPEKSVETSGEIEIITYNAASFAVRGNTKPYKDALGRKGLRGVFNAHLKDPNTGEKFAGWIFTNKKLSEVQNFVERIKGQ